MSYYGFNDESVFMSRRLSKGMTKLLKKWENMLNEYARKKIIYLRDNNHSIIDSVMKKNDSKLFSYDVELRRFEGLDAFVALLEYYKNLRSHDISVYEEEVKNNPNKTIHKLMYVPENYINISSIHSVTVKYRKIYELLHHVSPSTFIPRIGCVPGINPIWIDINRQMFGFFLTIDNFEALVNQELADWKEKFHPEIDLAALEGFELNVDEFMSFQAYEATKLMIYNWVKEVSEGIENFCKNKMYGRMLKYFFLYSSKKCQYAFVKGINEFKEILQEQGWVINNKYWLPFSDLYLFSVSVDMANVYDYIYEWYQNKNINSIFPNLNRLIFTGLEMTPVMQKEKVNYFDYLQELSSVRKYMSGDSTGFSVFTVENYFVLIQKGKKPLKVTFEGHQRFASTELLANLVDKILINPDYLFEMNFDCKVTVSSSIISIGVGGKEPSVRRHRDEQFRSKRHTNRNSSPKPPLRRPHPHPEVVPNSK
jgi:hypothetical protein